MWWPEKPLCVVHKSWVLREALQHGHPAFTGAGLGTDRLSGHCLGVHEPFGPIRSLSQKLSFESLGLTQEGIPFPALWTGTNCPEVGRSPKL